MGRFLVTGISHHGKAVDGSGQRGERIGFPGLERAGHLHEVFHGGNSRLFPRIVHRHRPGDLCAGSLETDLGHPFIPHGETDLGYQASEVQQFAGGLGHFVGRTRRGLAGGNLKGNGSPVQGDTLRSRIHGDESGPSSRYLTRDLGYRTVGSPVGEGLDGSAVGQEDGLPLRPRGLAPVRKVLHRRRKDDIAGKRRVGIHFARSIPGSGDLGNLNRVSAGHQLQDSQRGNHQGQCFFHIGSFNRYSLQSPLKRVEKDLSH